MALPNVLTPFVPKSFTGLANSFGGGGQDQQRRQGDYTQVVSVLQKILGVVEQMLAKMNPTRSGPDPLAALTGGSGVTPVATPVKNISADLANIGSKANVASAALRLVGNGLGEVVGILGQIRSAATSLGDAVAPFVRLANPGLVQRFTLASDDLTASIGRSLFPVMEHATEIVRMVADAFFALSGPINNLFNSALKPLDSVLKAVFRTLEPLIGIFGKWLSAIAAITRPLGDLFAIFSKIVLLHFEAAFRILELVMTPLLAVVEAVGLVLQDLTGDLEKFIDSVIQSVRDFFGIKTIAGGSVGAAVRPASIGSVEDYGAKARTAAFSLGTASSPAEKTAGLAKQIYDVLTEILNYIKNPSKAFETAAPKTTEIIREGVRTARSIDDSLPFKETRSSLGLTVSIPSWLPGGGG